jgi:hypothetical protein
MPCTADATEQYNGQQVAVCSTERDKMRIGQLLIAGNRMYGIISLKQPHRAY